MAACRRLGGGLRAFATDGGRWDREPPRLKREALDSAISRTCMQSGLIRRVNRRSPVYLLCALCLLPLALVAAEYGAGVPYFVLVAACVIQFVYPTVLGWGIVGVVFGLMQRLAVRDRPRSHWVRRRLGATGPVRWRRRGHGDLLSDSGNRAIQFRRAASSVEPRCLTAAAADERSRCCATDSAFSKYVGDSSLAAERRCVSRT
jgi:hypothetical protein